MASAESFRGRAYTAIRDRILAYTYRPGDQLSEHRVAAELEMSRTPVRAALEALEADGLVYSRSRLGFFVAHITPQMVSDVFCVRTALECHALHHLDSEAPTCRWRKLKGLFEVLRSPTSRPVGGEWLLAQEADRLFHREIVALADNPLALEMTDRVELRFARFRAMAWDGSERFRTGAAHHEQIVDAILTGSTAEAVRRLQHHLDDGRSLLLALMARPQRPLTLPPLTPGVGPVARWLDDEDQSPESAHGLLASGHADQPLPRDR